MFLQVSWLCTSARILCVDKVLGYGTSLRTRPEKNCRSVSKTIEQTAQRSKQTQNCKTDNKQQARVFAPQARVFAPPALNTTRFN